MRNMLSSIIKNKVVSCIVLLALGVLLVIAPRDALELYMRIIGAVLVAGAAVGMLIHFLSAKEDRSPIVLYESVVAAVIGIVFLAAPGFITNMLSTVFGIILLFNALLELVTALRLPAGRGVAVLLSLIGVAAGIVILCNPAALTALITQIIGGVLIYNAVIGLLSLLMSRRIPKDKK